MIGIDPASVVPLAPDADVPAAAERFAAGAADWVEDHFGSAAFDWAHHWYHARYATLARVFSREELIRLWHGCAIASDLDDHLQEHDPLVWKTQHSLWRYGGSFDFRSFVEAYNGLGRLAVDLPNFAVRLSHTRYCNTAAWAAHGREDPFYLDAPFGALLHYRGEHVLTIGFTPSAHGVLVAQVQLRQQRGNRWLFKLPMPHLDFALDLLHRAFPDAPLHLVTGSSTTAALRAAYGKKADELSPEVVRRVKCFYDQRLRDYARVGVPVLGTDDDGRTFRRLERRVAGGTWAWGLGLDATKLIQLR